MIDHNKGSGELNEATGEAKGNVLALGNLLPLLNNAIGNFGDDAPAGRVPSPIFRDATLLLGAVGR